MNIFRKIKEFNVYRKAINKIEFKLEDEYGIRIDRAKRLYTVVNIPPSEFGEVYSIRTQDINTISDKYIRSYLAELGNELNANGLRELYKTYDVKKVGRYSYLVVIGFSLFRSNIFYNSIISGTFISLLLIILFII